MEELTGGMGPVERETKTAGLAAPNRLALLAKVSTPSHSSQPQIHSELSHQSQTLAKWRLRSLSYCNANLLSICFCQNEAVIIPL